MHRSARARRRFDLHRERERPLRDKPAERCELEAKIESAIERRFQLPVKVVVLDRAAYGRIVKTIPKSWVGDEGLRANVALSAAASTRGRWCGS